MLCMVTLIPSIPFFSLFNSKPNLLEEFLQNIVVLLHYFKVNVHSMDEKSVETSTRVHTMSSGHGLDEVKIIRLLIKVSKKYFSSPDIAHS